MSKEVADNKLVYLWESDESERGECNRLERCAEFAWHQVAKAERDRDASYWLLCLIEHNMNKTQSHSERMLRQMSGDMPLFVWQGANAGLGSSRLRLVTANVKPNSHMRCRLPCFCAGATPTKDAQKIGATRRARTACVLNSGCRIVGKLLKWMGGSKQRASWYTTGRICGGASHRQRMRRRWQRR